jgi:glycine/D-amino acid oxidase-like deaminating enzyme/nitrite reductase/ring-hydroxylating ferredoxin subunit
VKTVSYWIDTAELPSFGKLDRDIEVDVAVVGGGITGLTAAYLLAREGKRVALLERNQLTTAESGHTTAHLTAMFDLTLQELAKEFGKDTARAVWDAGNAAISQIQLITQTEKVACELRRVPGYLVAALFKDPVSEADFLRKEAELGMELGFDTFYQDSVPGLHLPGVRIPNQAKFHVRQYLAGVARAAVRHGAQIFENSEASEFRKDPRTVMANGCRVRCEHVVIATHALTSGFVDPLSKNLLQTKIAGYNTYAVGASLPKGRLPEAMYWDTNDPYYYLRIDRKDEHDYLIWGGEDHKTGMPEGDENAHFARLEAALRRVLPEAVPDRRWSGQVLESVDGLPYIGCETDGQFLATAYAGNGMTFGTLAGMMARDWVMGFRNPWSGLFAHSRTKVTATSVWEYLSENKDYPMCLIKDHLFGAEVKSIDEVPAGEGRIAKIGGKKVAVYRKPDGEVFRLSPVCPHLGCIVSWNPAAQTWDCPCHGSRFMATGEVMTGPAESGLRDAEP